MNFVGITVKHDSGIAYYENDELKVIESSKYFNDKSYSNNKRIETAEIDELLSTIQSNYTLVQNSSSDIDTEYIVKHSECHAASGYYGSPFDKSLILSFDGSSEDRSATFFYEGNNNELTLLADIPIYFGFAYHIVYNWFEMTPGRLMSFAAFGNYNESLVNDIKKFITSINLKTIKYSFSNDSEFLKDHEIINIIKNLKISDKTELFKRFKTLLAYQTIDIKQLLDLFPFLSRVPSQNSQNIDTYDQECLDFVYTFQQIWSDMIVELLESYRNKYDNLIIVGGCALSGIANNKIINAKQFKNYHFTPVPDDSGQALGALLYTLKKKDQYSPYIGPYIHDPEYLNQMKAEFIWEKMETKELQQWIAKEIINDKIIGLIQGKSEIGPRALGNRSIIASPFSSKIKDKINLKIKNREAWRPFGPICSLESTKQFFNLDVPSYYMNIVCEINESYYNKLNAVSHIDNTTRPQTLPREMNPFIYDILKILDDEINEPILLNTSFNVNGKPTLNHLSEAANILRNTELDYVIYNNYIFKKK